LTFELVLHPGLKLKYFQQKEWEEDWIENAKALVHKVYVAQYEGKEDPIMVVPDMTTKLVCPDVIISIL